MSKFPYYHQFDSKDCGPACLRMVAKFYGKSFSIETLREYCFVNREGVSMLGISEAAETIGFRSLSASLPLENLLKDAPLPLIAFWKQSHFIVIYEIKRDKVYIGDPAQGLIWIDIKLLKKLWLNSKVEGVDTGLVLFLEPTPDFYLVKGEKESKAKLGYFLAYLKPYKSYFVQLALALLLSSLFALIFPFLSQSLIDIGINQSNFSFINLILISQLLLQTSVLFVEFIKGWIFLHMGTRISLSIKSDFLIKVLKLPMPFFETRSIGDLLQRMGDHSQIQVFLTSAALNIVFSVFNFIIFSSILIFYSPKIFVIFILGSTLYFIWTALFLNERKKLNYKSFAQSTENQNSLLQLLQGIPEIKLQNCEKKKRWEWERVQASQFKISISALKLGQVQRAGAFFIDQVKNILISFTAAKLVISGDISLGMMLSISYIIGQLSGPIEQVVGLVTSFQDAKISLERLNEIHGKDDEVDLEKDYLIGGLENENIRFDNVSFQYSGPNSEKVLKNISFEIPAKKTTAIVGTSGSGKTTLIKLLLKFYQPTSGEIYVSNTNLDNIHSRYWRGICGNVSQDGFLFSDTIANNISVSDDQLDKNKLKRAVEIANIKEFIESLPLRYNTKIGQDGNGISQGQKQRIQIARAIYKDPTYVFLDEATNSLDSHNEKIIIENLNSFLKNKTVVVIAHRLSTVKNADQIIVIEKGEIREIGTHELLLKNKKEYYNLIRDQLEFHSLN